MELDMLASDGIIHTIGEVLTIDGPSNNTMVPSDNDSDYLTLVPSDNGSDIVTSNPSDITTKTPIVDMNMAELISSQDDLSTL
jgi:hypothetical protein